MEIIGNSKNVLRLQKHFKKMFAGVAQVILSEDGTQVLGVSSKEGEIVSVTSSVNLSVGSRVQVLNKHPLGFKVLCAWLLWCSVLIEEILFINVYVRTHMITYTHFNMCR